MSLFKKNHFLEFQKKSMNRPYKLIHRLSNILFVPPMMWAGVVKCSESLVVTAHDTSEPLSVQTDTDRNNKLFKNRGEIVADTITH